MSIYQEIWDADQSGNGVRPILASQAGDTQAGYVKFPHVYDRLGAVRLDVSRDLPEGWFFSKFTGGVNVSNRSKTRSFVEGLLSIKGGADRYATAPFPSGSSPQGVGETGLTCGSRPRPSCGSTT